MQTALYRHFDIDGRLLYVGISKNAVQRLSQHTSSPWMQKIRTVTVEMCQSREHALEAEALAIRSEKPAYNGGRIARIAKAKNVLARYIAETGQTQRDFAAKLGVRDATVSAWVNGKRPSFDLAIAIERETNGNVPVTCWGDAAEHHGAA